MYLVFVYSILYNNIKYNYKYLEKVCNIKSKLSINSLIYYNIYLNLKSGTPVMEKSQIVKIL